MLGDDLLDNDVTPLPRTLTLDTDNIQAPILYLPKGIFHFRNQHRIRLPKKRLAKSHICVIIIIVSNAKNDCFRAPQPPSETDILLVSGGESDTRLPGGHKTLVNRQR